ncbi:hypothetical protein NQD34_004420 [Periophthalmus magnuspinnatus]|nr:hypothetical protein NQD34_004420 [Periophthalmus magnuspinnatus]
MEDVPPPPPLPPPVEELAPPPQVVVPEPPSFPLVADTTPEITMLSPSVELAPSIKPAVVAPPSDLTPPPELTPVESVSVAPPIELIEDRLRQKIKAELELSLEEEITKRRQVLQKQLEELRSIAIAEAEAAAQAQVEQQVKQTLEAEKAAYMENLTQSIAKERMKTEDEKLMVQLYAHKLEMREEEMKKRDTLYKEHIAKLESKCSQFYKVTSDSFQKSKEETLNRFARFNIQPVCGDLQSQILKCYQENPGKTLSCSGIASAYMQCVNKAKMDNMSTRG